jgi:hypothetical protein
MDSFHRLFKDAKRNVRENNGLDVLGGFCQPRLNELYNKIIEYL